MSLRNRIDHVFQNLKNENRSALIGFITAGDPGIERSKTVLADLSRDQLDLLELGMPYSDPMADGPIIQQANQRALAAGFKMKNLFETVQFLRHQSEIPILVMGYYNPIFAYGLKRFAQDFQQAGGDGCLIVDLPPEESREFHGILARYRLHQIFLLAPTSDSSRIKKVCQMASGFIYFVSLEGITGAALGQKEKIEEKLKQIRQYTELPLVAGFGIKTAKDAACLAALADGIVVGSALIQHLEKEGWQPPLLETKRWLGTLLK